MRFTTFNVRAMIIITSKYCCHLYTPPITQSCPRPLLSTQTGQHSAVLCVLAHIDCSHLCCKSSRDGDSPDSANKYSDCDEPGINYPGSRHRLTAEHLEIGQRRGCTRFMERCTLICRCGTIVSILASLLDARYFKCSL